jgi:hypothetical protein
MSKPKKREDYRLIKYTKRNGEAYWKVEVRCLALWLFPMWIDISAEYNNIKDAHERIDDLLRWDYDCYNSQVISKSIEDNDK